MSELPGNLEPHKEPVPPLAHSLTGLFETHLNVASLARSIAFYGTTLGLELGIVIPERGLAIYWVGTRGKAMLGLWEKPPAQIQLQHFAFEVELADLTGTIQELQSKGIEVMDFFRRPTDEPNVFGWMPAASVYFSDPDGHLLEILAMLPDQPRPEIGVVTLVEWRKFVAEGA